MAIPSYESRTQRRPRHTTCVGLAAGVIRQSLCVTRLTLRAADEKRRITRPVGRVESRTLIAVKARLRPVAYAANQAMFQRIDINVIDMPSEVVFVADHVFPVATLPDTPARLVAGAPPIDIR